MTGAYVVERGAEGSRGGVALSLAACSIAIAGALGMALAQRSATLTLLTAAGLFSLAVAGLALMRLDVAVALGFALLGIVLVEPWPADVAFVVTGAVAAVTGRFHLRRVPGVAIGLVGLLFALNLLSAVEVVDAQRAAAFAATTVYVALLGLWLASWVTTPRRARLVAGGYVFGAVSSAAVGLLALLLGMSERDLVVVDDRARGLFEDASVFGPFLVPALLLVIEETFSPRLFGLHRAVSASLVGLLSLAVVFSYSAGAWANASIGTTTLLVVLALRRRGRRALFLVTLVAAAAVSITAVVTFTGSGAFLSERARAQSFDLDRSGAQLAELAPSQRYPFGVGPGQFEQVSSDPAQNTYARVLAEQGLPGAVAFLALMLATLGAAVANAIARRDLYGIGSAALLGAWCGLLANGVAIDTLHWRHLWIVAALVWAGWAYRRIADRREPQARSATWASSSAREGAPSEYVASGAPVATTPRSGP
jgi:hypothetical protein